MFISVIIPTYNLLEDCIKALDPVIQKPKCLYEVIISDDKIPSDAKILIETKYNWAKWVEGKHNGVAANRNNGVNHAKGDWIIFIDNDCIPDENLINTYLKYIINNPNILVFEGCIKPNRKKRHFLEEAPINENGGCFWTCNVMINKDYFLNRLAGFDERFFLYGEDIDIRERIYLDKHAILFVKEAFVIHPWRVMNDSDEWFKYKQKAYILLSIKYPSIKDGFKFSIINELRFLIKDVFFNLFKFKGKGLFMYIKIHYKHVSIKKAILKLNDDEIKYIANSIYVKY
jgi:GT2 family glycosyltransferase